MIREYIITIVFAVFASIFLTSTFVSGKVNMPTATTPPISNTLIKKSLTPSLFDKFGIKEIYPTKPDGGRREWYVNMSSPLNDTIFSLSSGGTEKGSLNATTSNTTKITREPDGSWQLQGQHTSGKYSLQG